MWHIGSGSDWSGLGSDWPGSKGKIEPLTLNQVQSLTLSRAGSKSKIEPGSMCLED